MTTHHPRPPEDHIHRRTAGPLGGDQKQNDAETERRAAQWECIYFYFFIVAMIMLQMLRWGSMPTPDPDSATGAPSILARGGRLEV